MERPNATGSLLSQERRCTPMTTLGSCFRRNDKLSSAAVSAPLKPLDLGPVTDLHDRVVLITGASGGLGQALSMACAAAGATVVVHGRVVRKLEALYDRIMDAGHPEPVILPLDLAKAGADDFANIASALNAQLGRLDALVHTAALLGSLSPPEP